MDEQIPLSKESQTPIPTTSLVNPLRSRNKIKIIVLTLLAIVFAYGVYFGADLYYGFGGLPKDERPETGVIIPIGKQQTAVHVGKQYCFIRHSNLVCIDAKGQNRIRYDLPTIEGREIADLVPSADSKSFIATVPYLNTNGAIKNYSLYILNSKLQPIKKITLDPKYTPEDQSWSIDEKSIFLTLRDTNSQQTENTNFSRNIYRYTLATDKLQQIKASGDNITPYEIQDEKILYSSYYKSDPNGTWLLSVMNTDGTFAQPLQYGPELNFVYERSIDTVYILNDILSEKGSISYGKLADVLEGKKLHTIKASISSAYNTVSAFDEKTLVLSTEHFTEILDLPSGKNIAKFNKAGTPVGILTTTQYLAKSKEQQEGKYDSITGLNKVPPDFVPYIKAEYDKFAVGCKPDGPEVKFGIFKVVRDRYIGVVKRCGKSSITYYVKQKDKWKLAIAQELWPYCIDVNKYAIPKELIPECVDTNKNKIINTNP